MHAYADPLFRWFVLGGTAVSALAFLLFAAPLTWLAWRSPAWAEPWRIQTRRADVPRWLGPGLRRWALNQLVLFAVVVAIWPLLRPWSGVHMGPLPPWYLAAAQIVLFAYLDDALYYWMHRTMHRGWLWKRVHSVHHRVVTPSAVTGHYMHPLEYVLTGLLMLVGPVVFGAHIVTVYAWVTLRQLEAAEGHSGYHVPFSPLNLLPGSHGADHHDFHHAKFRGNYAGYFAWMDHAFGTFVPGYEAWRAYR